MYEEMGHSSVMVGVDLTAVKNSEKGAALAKQQTFWDENERAMYTEMMEEYMKPLWEEHPDLEQISPIVHTFSNNGIQTWFNLTDVFQPHKGVIFDSGPACPPDWDVPGKIFRLNNPNAPLLIKIAVTLGKDGEKNHQIVLVINPSTLNSNEQCLQFPWLGKIQEKRNVDS